jgi:hypothetical protein
VQPLKCSPELEIARPVDPQLLVVSRGRKPQLDHCPTDRHLQRQQVALVEICAVGGDRVDLAEFVRTMNEALGPATTPSCRYLHDIADSRGPFALHAQQLGPQIKDEVISLVA